MQQSGRTHRDFYQSILDKYKFMTLNVFVEKYFQISEIVNIEENIFVSLGSEKNSEFSLGSNVLANKLIFNTNKWKKIFTMIGKKNSKYLLRNCFIVEIINGSLVQLNHTIYQLYKKEISACNYLKRDSLFISVNKLPEFGFRDVYDYLLDSKIDTDSLYIDSAGTLYDPLLTKLLHLKSSLQLACIRYRKIPFSKIFDSYFSSNITDESTNSTIATQPVDPSKIASFLLCISTKFLKPLFEKSEFIILKGKLTLLVMRNKWESLSFHEIYMHFSLNKCKMLKTVSKISASDAILRQKIFQNLLVYLFQKIYTNILSYFFYIIVDNQNKLKILYFINSSWRSRSKEKIESYLSAFQPVKFQNHKVPAATIRCVNKNNGLRIITNCSKSWKKSFVCRRNNKTVNYSTSINMQSVMTKTVFREILKQNKRENDLTSEDQYFSYNCKSIQFKLNCLNQPFNLVYSKLQNYLENVTDRQFLVKVDVKNCFHEINQSKLVRIIKNTEIIKDSCYYCYCEDKCLIYNKQTGSVKVSKNHKVVNYCSNEVFRINKDDCNKITQKIKTCWISGKELRKKIIEEVCDIWILHDENHYKVTKGIPQGFTLSSALCSLYLENILSKTFGFIKKGVLVNYVDDLLLLTPCKDEVKRFMKYVVDHKSYKFSNNVTRNKLLLFNQDKIDSNTHTDFSSNTSYSNEKGKEKENIDGLSSFKLNDKSIMKTVCNNFNDMDIENETYSEMKFIKNNITWCGLRIYDQEFTVKRVLKPFTLPFTVSISPTKPGAKFKEYILSTIMLKKIPSILFSRSNKLHLQNLYDFILGTFLKSKVAFTRMPFVSRKYAIGVLSETILHLVDFNFKYNICSKTKLLEIIKTALEDSKVLQIKIKKKFK